MTCDLDDFIDSRVDKLITQYRETPEFRFLCEKYVAQLEPVAFALCDLPNYFDIDTAVGDQLTILGKIIGWPRVHCKGVRLPVFGFACPDDNCTNDSLLVKGFCEDAVWDCGLNPTYGSFEFTDDELYRKFLKSMIIKNDRDFTREALLEALNELFGADAGIYEEEAGKVKVVTGRSLTAVEVSIAHLYKQVLPIAYGVEVDIWESQGKVFGFGFGWGGFCDGSFPTLVN